MFVINAMFPLRKTNRKSNVSRDRYKTPQEFYAITTRIEVICLGIGKLSGLLDQNPGAVDGNVFAHKNKPAFPKPFEWKEELSLEMMGLRSLDRSYCHDRLFFGSYSQRILSMVCSRWRAATGRKRGFSSCNVESSLSVAR